MELYFSIIILLFVLKSSELLPLPKYQKSVENVEQNKIIFPSSGAIVFDPVENEVSAPVFEFRKLNWPRIFSPSEVTSTSILLNPEHEESLPTKTYSDKIFFRTQNAERKRNHFGYIRKFSGQRSKGQLGLQLRTRLVEQSSSEDVSSVAKLQSGKDIQNTSTTNESEPFPAEAPPTKPVDLNNRQGNQEEPIIFGRYDSQEQTTPTPRFVTAIVQRQNKPKSKSKNLQQENLQTQDQITFLSLFRTPNIQRAKSPDGGEENIEPCPENFRRDHHGVCRRTLRRIRYKIIEEEI